MYLTCGHLCKGENTEYDFDHYETSVWWKEAFMSAYFHKFKVWYPLGNTIRLHGFGSVTVKVKFVKVFLNLDIDYKCFVSLQRNMLKCAASNRPTSNHAQVDPLNQILQWRNFVVGAHNLALHQSTLFLVEPNRVVDLLWKSRGHSTALTKKSGRARIHIPWLFRRRPERILEKVLAIRRSRALKML